MGKARRDGSSGVFDKVLNAKWVSEVIREEVHTTCFLSANADDARIDLPLNALLSLTLLPHQHIKQSITHR